MTTDYVSLSVVLTALVAAIGAAAVNIIVAWRTNTVAKDTNKKVDGVTASTQETSNKVDVVAQTTKTIEGHVNSAAAAAAMKIDSLEKQIVELTRSMANMKETSALLAQDVVSRRRESKDKDAK